MSKLSSIKELVYKQKVEFDKPKVMYQNNKNFQTVVDYTEFYNNEKIKHDTILVIGNNGKTRNIKQLLELLIKKYSNKKIIFADECDEYKTNNHNENQIQSISKESKKYLKALTNSKIIITYEQLPTYFIRKNNQKVIQLSDFFTGKFTENNQFDARTVSLQRSLFQTTHILFKNNLEADMYINIFNLKNIYKGNVYKNVNFYFPSEELIDNFKNDLLIITKKYSQKEMSLIIAKANIYLDDYFIYVEPSLYDYYRKFNGLEFLIIKNEVSKEDLHLHNLKIMSDNYSDLIGAINYHFSLEEPNIFVNHIKKQIYLSNFKVIENILNDKEEEFVNIYSEDKKNILMYCGGFLNNGITSSAINLSNSIDYNNYNLIIIDKGNLGEEERENMKRLNSNANIVYRVGQSNVNFSEFRKNQFVISRRGYRNFLGKKELRNFYQRELKRLLGNIEIDIAIDFSGYVPFWTAILGFSFADKKVVYQHNDLKSETEKVIDGKFKHKYILPRVFSLYRFFDKIISVSLQTMYLNAENLKEYAPTNKFDYVNNQIDIEDINNKINENEEKKQISISNKKYYVVKKMNKVSILEDKESQDNTIQLITIGRLSPEKDHQKLFLALHKFIKEHPNVDIQLKVLGSGVLNDELNKSIDQLELRNNVSMMGQVTNPYTYLNEADCFILSSNHEGQPMVLLEALALKKRVIATDITGNRSVLEGTNGILVENSIDGLKEGIVSLLEGKIKPNTKFDIEEYNEKAISRFYKIVCGNH